MSQRWDRRVRVSDRIQAILISETQQALTQNPFKNPTGRLATSLTNPTDSSHVFNFDGNVINFGSSLPYAGQVNESRIFNQGLPSFTPFVGRPSERIFRTISDYVVCGDQGFL